MNEAANYIKHQQRKIKEMTERRDALRRIVLPPSANPDSLHMNGDFPTPSVAVVPCLAGVEVMIGSGSLLDGLSLSTVIKVLEEEEELAVLRCVFSNANEQLIYTLQCQVRVSFEYVSFPLNSIGLDSKGCMFCCRLVIRERLICAGWSKSWWI